MRNPKAELVREEPVLVDLAPFICLHFECHSLGLLNQQKCKKTLEQLHKSSRRYDLSIKASEPCTAYFGCLQSHLPVAQELPS